MTQAKEQKAPKPIWQRACISMIEVFVVAPMQALEEGFIWGGAIAVGLLLNGYAALWLLEHFGII